MISIRFGLWLREVAHEPIKETPEGERLIPVFQKLFFEVKNTVIDECSD